MFEFSLKHKLKDFEVDVDLDIRGCGNVVGIFGVSGHGKSTLLRCLAGMEESANYKLMFEDIEYQNAIAEDNPCVLNRQKALLFPNLTVSENLGFVSKHSKWRGTKNSQSDLSTDKKSLSELTIAQVESWFQLTSLMDKSVAQLSGGEQQRVSLARSLLSGKPILLLDEPFSALDWSTRLECLNRLRLIADEYKVFVVIVSHSLKELALSSDYILHVRSGKVVEQGKVQALVNKLSQISGDSAFAQLDLELQQYLPDYHLSQWRVVEQQSFDALGNIKEIQDDLGSLIDAQHSLSNNDQPSVYIKEDTGPENTKTETENSSGQAGRLSLQEANQGAKKKAMHETRRVNIDAEQVSISREFNPDTSMLNQLKVEVVSISEQEHAALITLKVCGQMLFAKISKLSLDKLNLSEGEMIYAQFKAL